MSAYAQLNGHFDFNRTPLAPPRTRVIAHEKPYQRASWDPHGLDGYYLGPALDHYRCYQLHITKTKGTRIVDTVEFFPATFFMPRTSSKDLASIAAMELSDALQHPAPAAPFSQIGTVQLQALRQLSDFFSRRCQLVQHLLQPRRHYNPQQLEPQCGNDLPIRRQFHHNQYITPSILRQLPLSAHNGLIQPKSHLRG
jgi:hypothetical protein